MGKVVKLDSSPRAKANGHTRKTPNGRRKSKTALVLGGGGFTGGVYEIGALRALDLLSVNRDITDFDVYVGTSAGAIIASLAANGVSPTEMMRVVDGDPEGHFPDLDLGMLLKPNYREFALKGLQLPFNAVSLAAAIVRQRGSFSAVDFGFQLASALPNGFYSGAGIQEYLNNVLSMDGYTDDFRELSSELYLATTDLDTCQRVVMGAENWDDVPISEAARASAALPMIYKPVGIKGREFVDGGVVSTTNVDIAVEAGAKFIVVINPLVPYINDYSTEIETPLGSRFARVCEMSFPKIAFQSFKLLAYQRLHDVARRWEERYPGVDILLIEPAPDDSLMFETNIMNYASRIAIARHGFQSVTVKLASDYDSLREVCHRHGIEISATRVRRVLRHFEAEKEKTNTWRRILEQTTGALLRQSAAK